MTLVRVPIGVVTEIPASIIMIEASINDGSSGAIVTTRRIIPPQIVEGTLFSSLSLTCHSIGVPSPKVTWTSRDGESFPVGDTLVFEEMQLTDRGFYKCQVENNLKSEISSEIQIDLGG